MTTITIKDGTNLNFKKTVFEDLNDFLNTIKQDVSDFNDPHFKDTILTKELIREAKETREKIKKNPESFFEI